MRFAVIVPAFDAERSIDAVLHGISSCGAVAGAPIIAIDDGSRDGTAARMDAWREGDPSLRHVIRRAANGGKAAALVDGFAECARIGISHVVTMDADGQHAVDDLPAIVAAARANPSALVLGRRAVAADYPARRLIGRRMSDLAILAASGVAVDDSPCGFRVYPIDATRIRCRSGRYAWEEEFLVRAAWRRIPIVQVGIATKYSDDAIGGKAPSHYVFTRDWPEGIAILLSLVLRTIIPLPPTVPTLRTFARAFDVRRAFALRRSLAAERWLFVAAWFVGGAFGSGLPLLWALIATTLVALPLHAFVPAAWIAAVLTWYVAERSSAPVAAIACIASTIAVAALLSASLPHRSARIARNRP